MNQELPADRPELLIGIDGTGQCRNATEIGIGTRLVLWGPIAIYANLSGAVCRRHCGRREVQDVDVGIARQCRRWIDYPEEPASLEVQVAQLPILGLAGGLANGVAPLGDLASLLCGGQSLELERSDLEPRIHSEVVGRYCSGDEPGLRRLERDGADLYPPDDLVFQSLVVNLNVVIGGEVSLGIVVDIDMHPAADGATGAQVHLIIEARGLEAATAAGIRVE